MMKGSSEIYGKDNTEEKPFALMFPEINSIKEVCQVSPLEERLLSHRNRL